MRAYVVPASLALALSRSHRQPLSEAARSSTRHTAASENTCLGDSEFSYFSLSNSIPSAFLHVKL